MLSRYLDARLRGHDEKVRPESLLTKPPNSEITPESSARALE